MNFGLSLFLFIYFLFICMLSFLRFAFHCTQRIQSFALAFFLLLSSAFAARAQAPTWQTAIALGQTTGSSSLIIASALDEIGNIIVTGQFTGTITLGTTTLRSVSSFNDTFVAKWNPTSNSFVWAVRIGGTQDDRVKALALQGGSIFLTGNTDLTRIFVTKLTDAGSLVWTQQVTGSRYPSVYALAVSGANVYIGGCFAGTLTLGSTTLTNIETSGRYTDLFVAKLSDAGATASFRWAQRGGSAFDDCAYALAVNGSSVYVAGTFIGNASAKADFGSTELVGASDYSNDIVVAKLTDAGNNSSFTWAQRAGGLSSDFPQALVVSGNSLYMTGTFGSTYREQADFGSARLTNSSATGDTDDIFVTKLTDAGTTGRFNWAQRAGGLLNDRGATLTVSGQNVYVAGFFASLTATFGSTTLTNQTTSGVDQEIYVAHLLDNGTNAAFDWVQQAGGVASESVTSLLVSGSRLYAAGYFTSPTVRFGSLAVTHPNPDDLTTGFIASLGTTFLATAPAALAAPLRLWPNPAGHMATLSGVTAGGLVQVYDAVGTVIFTTQADATGTARLVLPAGLSNGLYLVRSGTGPALRLMVK
jgi:hypothetical protein